MTLLLSLQILPGVCKWDVWYMFWPQGWDNTMLTRGFFREVSQADGNRSSMTGVVRTLGKSC